MSMEHKAFVLRHRAFRRELRPLLEAALASGNPTPLIAFIRADLGSLRDPYEGEPLGDDWEDLLETKDVQEYGDFALTRYYDPNANIGIGRDWQEVQRVLESEMGTSVPILGEPLGPQDHLFDPGRMGSYFQSEDDVRRNLAQIEGVGRPALEPLALLLREAVAEGAGLYVTF